MKIWADSLRPGTCPGCQAPVLTGSHATKRSGLFLPRNRVLLDPLAQPIAQSERVATYALSSLHVQTCTDRRHLYADANVYLASACHQDRTS